MNKATIAVAALLLINGTTIWAQRTCGTDKLVKQLESADTHFAQLQQEEQAALQPIAEAYAREQSSTSAKTTAVSPIPVVFHILLTTAQFTQLGGNTGIARRVDSQIAVLNRDFNRQNSDSVLIPTGFKSRYGTAGIRFGLAHTSPTGTSTPGYEVKIIPNTPGGFNEGATFEYGDAKRSASGGLDAWDVTKYYNVWCLNFSDNTDLLGIATPYSFTAAAGGPLPNNNRGVCIKYTTLGKRVSSSDTYASGVFDKGRTLTHETGHFFTLRHIWGDDGGDCNTGAGGLDDGIADTPPQAEQTYGAPALPVFDSCSPSGNGIMCMNFMDYTNDAAMQMYTTNQASVMASRVATSGVYYSLTQNPTLLNWPLLTTTLATETGLQLFPNPASGVIYLSYDQNNDQLLQVTVSDIAGRQVATLEAAGTQNDLYTIDLSGLSKGIYLVRCNFASGSITRKITLQ